MNFYKYPIKSVFLICSIIIGCQQKKNSSASSKINDLLFISRDTGLLIKKNVGLFITSNGGHSWSILNNKIHLNQIMIDSNGILWGLKNWGGIHEKSYSEMFISSDTGKHWNPYLFKNQNFFTTKILSALQDGILITDQKGKVYKLANNNANNLTYTGDSIENNKVAEWNFRFLSNSSENQYQINIDSLKDVINASIIFQILPINDTLFIAGSCGGGYKACFYSYDLRKNQLNNYSVGGQQILGIRRDKLGRIWLFGDGGLYLRTDDSLVVKKNM